MIFVHLVMKRVVSALFGYQDNMIAVASLGEWTDISFVELINTNVMKWIKNPRKS